MNHKNTISPSNLAKLLFASAVLIWTSILFPSITINIILSTLAGAYVVIGILLLHNKN